MTVPDRFASLDIGSNTVRFLIAEKAGEKFFRPLCVERRITRLGGNFSLNGYLAEESISRTVTAISEFSFHSRNERVKEVFAVATGVVREAKNGTDFLATVKKETGIGARLLSGAEEARLTLEGVLWSLPNAPPSYLVMDVGGWSTEILWIQEGNLRKAMSTNLGAVSASERFLLSDPPEPSEIRDLDEHIKEELQEIHRGFEQAGWGSPNASAILVGTAGTITTLAAIDQGLKDYDPRKINGHPLPLQRIEALFIRLAGIRAAERKKVPGLEEGREDLILAGTRIVLKSMEIFRADTLVVVNSGLLEGVMVEEIRRMDSPRRFAPGI